MCCKSSFFVFPQQLGTVRGQDLCLTSGKSPWPGATRAQVNSLSLSALPNSATLVLILLLQSSRLRDVRIGIHQLIKSMLEMTPTSLALLPAQPDTLTSSFTPSLKHKHTCKHGNSLDHYGLRLGLPQAQVVCSNRRAHTRLSV